MTNSGKRLKQRREKLGITLDDLATKAGYTSQSKRTAVAKIEAGKSDITLSKVESIAAALGTNIYYLLGMIDIEDLTDQEIIELIRKSYSQKPSSDDSEH